MTNTETPTHFPADKLDKLLSLPLAVFLSEHFMEEALTRVGLRFGHGFSPDRAKRFHVLIIGLCMEPALVESCRQPTVRDLLRLTNRQVVRFPGIGNTTAYELDGYLKIFGLALRKSESSSDNADIETQMLDYLGPKKVETTG